MPILQSNSLLNFITTTLLFLTNLNFPQKNVSNSSMWIQTGLSCWIGTNWDGKG